MSLFEVPYHLAVELLALPANMVKPLDLRYACAAVFGSVAVAHWRNNTLDSFLADHKSMRLERACSQAPLP